MKPLQVGVSYYKANIAINYTFLYSYSYVRTIVICCSGRVVYISAISKSEATVQCSYTLSRSPQVLINNGSIFFVIIVCLV